MQEMPEDLVDRKSTLLIQVKAWCDKPLPEVNPFSIYILLDDYN